MRLRVPEPRIARFGRARIPRHSGENHDHMRVVVDRAGGCGHRFAQIGHDQVDAGREALRLLRSEIAGEAVDVRIAPRWIEPCGCEHRADTDGCGIAEITEGLQVVRPRDQIIGTGRAHLVDHTAADGIHRGLVIPHGIHDRLGVLRPVKGQGRWRRHRREIRHRPARQFLQRQSAKMRRALARRKEAGRHARLPAIRCRLMRSAAAMLDGKRQALQRLHRVQRIMRPARSGPRPFRRS